MRIGMFLAYWPWFSFEEQVKLSRLGDEVRLDSVWISEAWGHDAASRRSARPTRAPGPPRSGRPAGAPDGGGGRGGLAAVPTWPGGAGGVAGPPTRRSRPKWPKHHR